MSKPEASLNDFRDVKVRSLAGTLERKVRPKYAQLSVSTEVSIDTDKNSATLDVEVRLTGSRGRADEEDYLPIYTGSVSLNVVPAKDFEFTDATNQAKDILELAWPFTRSALTEHALRLGSPPLRLPLVAMTADMERVAADALREV